MRARDFCIYLDTFKKVFAGLEQVDECAMVGFSALGRLVYLDVRKIAIKVLGNGTYSE